MSTDGRPRYALFAGLLVCLGVAALPLDLPVARWLDQHTLRGDVRKLLLLSEVFAHGYGVCAILLTIWVVQRPRFGIMLRLICCSLGAGLLADVFKLFIWRTRPARFDLTGDVLDTFQGFLPWISGPIGNAFNRAQTSLPSAHTAVAFGLATVLGWMFPRGRGLFYVFAVMVAMQRIMVGAHFLSDVVWGAAVSFLVARLCLVGPGLPRFVDDLEPGLPWFAVARHTRSSAAAVPHERPNVITETSAGQPASRKTKAVS
jgi:membrane-associated phospholipid phosphatase